MDITERKITKIAREAERLVLLTMREEGVGTAEIDLIHALRHNPGCTQARLAEILHADKAAQPANLSHCAGGNAEIVQNRGGIRFLRIPDHGIDGGRSVRICRAAG